MLSSTDATIGTAASRGSSMRAVAAVCFRLSATRMGAQGARRADENSRTRHEAECMHVRSPKHLNIWICHCISAMAKLTSDYAWRCLHTAHIDLGLKIQTWSTGAAASFCWKSWYTFRWWTVVDLDSSITAVGVCAAPVVNFCSGWLVCYTGILWMCMGEFSPLVTLPLTVL